MLLPVVFAPVSAFATDVQVSQSGNKKRIVFDYSKQPAPVAASPTPSPEQKETPQPEAVPVFAPTPTPTPTPTPVPMPEPAKQQETNFGGSVLPAKEAAPSPKETPAKLAEWSDSPKKEPEKKVENPKTFSSPLPVAKEGSASISPIKKEEVLIAPEAVLPGVSSALPTPSPKPKPVVSSTPEQPSVAEQKPTAEPKKEVFPTPSPASESKEVAKNAEPMPTPLPVPKEPVRVLEETPLPEYAGGGAEPQIGASGELPTPTQSVTINLIYKLVQRGILTKEEADEMVRQAEAEAEVARMQAQTEMVAIAQTVVMQVVPEQVAVAVAQSEGSSDDIRVAHIPEPVRMQIKEDIKSELAAEKSFGKWASGVGLPKWVQNTHPFFDLRVRFEGDYFPNGNDASGAFPNFNAINTGLPYDTTGDQFAPQLNVDQNRTQFRLRARLGAEIELADNFSTGFRIATGQNNSPVSTNQSMGLASSATQGQGGNFSKYALWLDRAFIRYDYAVKEKQVLGVMAGRIDNPFVSTKLLWDDDLGFDGAALTAKYEVFSGVTPFITSGAFVVYNTDFNFSSNQPAKFASYDKYLYAVQTGVGWKPSKDWEMKVAAAYYYFHNIEGKLSSPYSPQNQSDASDTDNSRPSFAQKGNTYMAIRNIVPDASNDYGAINQWQYYGLASQFHEVALTGRLDYNGFEPVQVSLVGEVVQNVGFNKTDVGAIAVNNRGAIDATELDAIGAYEGNPLGWLVELKIGTPSLARRWDWMLDFGYRYIGSDAVVDGFNDSDFGLGGTNMKGFTVGGHLSLSENVFLSLRWMGSDSIAGPTYKTNIIQFDINSKF